MSLFKRSHALIWYIMISFIKIYLAMLFLAEFTWNMSPDLNFKTIDTLNKFTLITVMQLERKFDFLGQIMDYIILTITSLKG